YKFGNWNQSPRASLIYNGDAKGLFKLSVQRSIRENTLMQLYANHYFHQGKPDPEKFDGVEFSYNNKFKDVNTTVTTFYNKVDLLGWSGGANQTAGATTKTGTLRVGGVELEAEYKSPA